jgi:hypothetical protein
MFLDISSLVKNYRSQTIISIKKPTQLRPNEPSTSVQSNQQEMAKDGPITHGHKGSVQYVISCKTLIVYQTAI